MEKILAVQSSRGKLKNFKVDYDELVFMRRNAPARFVGIITDSLKNDSINVNRVQVHKEINTLKEDYNEEIICRARKLLLAITGKEYIPIQEIKSS